LGINTVAKSTLARANDRQPCLLFENLFYALLSECMRVTEARSFSFTNPLYSLDATVINLCLSLFDWATYRTQKGAVKMHVLLNNRTYIPELITVSNGNMADVTAAKKMTLSIPRGSIMVFDRGYVDYTWWKELDGKGLFFVTRTKENMQVIVSEKKTALGAGILADEQVWVGDPLKDVYGKEMRRVRYMDAIQGELVFLTNNMNLTALEIRLVYKERWQIELFFKWIKQNLKIKTFLGTSRNAVLSQIWIAMIYYLLLVYLKFQTKCDRSLLELTWMIKETLFSRRPLIDLLSLTPLTVSKIVEPEVWQLPLSGV
jgi:putative transposase